MSVDMPLYLSVLSFAVVGLSFGLREVGGGWPFFGVPGVVLFAVAGAALVGAHVLRGKAP